MMYNILEIQNITKVYPGVVALDNVSMTIRKGEVHGIIGENGAGKSTLIKTITGAISPESGIIRFEGKEYTHLTPQISKEIGIGVIYQEFNLVPALSVAENVFLGNYSGKGFTVDFKEMNEKTSKAMERIGVKIDPKKLVWSLTVGHQQIVEIMRSLVKDVKIIIMDEPTAPLTNTETEQLFKIIKSLKEQGITIVYISHRLEELFELTDRVSVMRDGQYITTVNTSETTMKELIKYMVGRDLSDTYPKRQTPIGEEVLRVEHLSGNGVSDINFTLHKGEILGFSGLLGCGRTETMQLIFGVVKKTSGKIFLNNQEVKILNTTDALSKGIGLIPEDRKKHGVFLHMSVKWNNSIGCLRKKLMKHHIIVDKREEIKLSNEYVEKLKVKTPSVNQLVTNLSGGNQQKVVVAKVMATDAEIMIFDEPTRGIDVGAKQEMYLLIRKMVSEGKSVLLISSEMGEVIGLSDRIVVLHEGRQMGILERDEFDQEHILTLASGIEVKDRSVIKYG